MAELFQLNLDRIIKALGLKEQIGRELRDGVVMVLDVTRFIDLQTAATPAPTVPPLALKTRVIPIAQPAAGADWTFTVANGVRWNLRLIHAKLVTTTAVSHEVEITVTDSDGNAGQFVNLNATAAAAATYFFGWVFGGSNDQVFNSRFRMALPPMNLRQGTTVNVQSALAAGDQWSQVFAIVEETVDA